MSEISATSTAPADNQPKRSPAVQSCVHAYQQARLRNQASGASHDSQDDSAASAYRKAMPELSSYYNIRDFIACTAHGMALRAIDTVEGSKLLYAAQVALGALRMMPRELQTPDA